MLNELRDARPPDAETAERQAWSVTAQAFAERSPRRRPRSGFAALVAAAAMLALFATLLALTPPGDAVADWMRRVVAPAPTPPAQRPVAVPGPGRVLVVGTEGLRIVGRPGTGRSLGRWAGAAWSPNGRYVAAWRGRELAALAPDGSRRWTVRTAAPITAARWSPEGFHVAYLHDRSLRVVAGNGLRDRPWRTAVASVAPAFRPNARRTLAWVRADGRILVEDVFTGARRARSGPRLGRDATALAWTGDGRHLAVLTGTVLRVWTIRTGTVRTIRLDGRAVAVAASPSGPTLAVLTHDAGGGVSAITLHRPSGSTLATTRVRSRLHDLAFSPDGETLIAAAPKAPSWLVLESGGRALAARPTSRAPTGHLAGWCCR